MGHCNMLENIVFWHVTQIDGTIYISFEMVSLAQKEGWIGFIKLFESLNLFSIESDGLESLDVNLADQYTFSRLKYKITD